MARWASYAQLAQAMIIGDDSDPFKLSQVAGCVQRAHVLNPFALEGYRRS